MGDDVRYLGIDLAWGGQAPSGVCVTDASGRVIHDDVLGAGDLAAWVLVHRGARSVLAIDAPLLFRPTTSVLRPAERALHVRFGRQHAGPFPGGPGSTAMRGHAIAPALALVEAVGGYVTDPFDRTADHRAIEVFPAPTWITLGGLDERIVYKRGRLADRRVGLARVREVLARVVGPGATLGAALEARWATASTATEWKACEDLLDARLCAHVARLWHERGADDWVELGGGAIEDGCIVVPPGPMVAGTVRA